LLLDGLLLLYIFHFFVIVLERGVGRDGGGELGGAYTA